MNLPANHCPQDAKWIREQLEQLQFSLRDMVCERYSDVYSCAYKKHDVSYQKEGKARYAANTRLREFVEKYGNSSLGVCELPPKLS